MALVIADRVRETTSSAGTGTITLTGAFSGFQPFSTIGNGNTTYYCIIDAAAGAWEVGIGTYTTSGNTLSRDTVLSSSNGGSLVAFAVGLKDVICTQPSERAVYAVGTDVVAENNAKVPNSLLANSGITFGSTAQALGSTVTALNGVSIGGSTAAAGNFTTLTTSSTVTHNAGTANGVAYLNGSKVLTTGSALTFDGTALRNTSGQFEGIDNMTLSALVSGTNATVLTLNSAGTAGTTRFQINNTEQMRLTSTGLGIGTSSPQGQLSLGSAASGQKGLTLDWTGSGGPYSVASFTADRGTGEVRNFAFTNFFQTWYTNNTERMRLDSSGNLGLGVTPSAWAAGWRALQLPSGVSFGAHPSLSLAYMNANTYFDGTNNRYVANGLAGRFVVDNFSGGFAWSIAPSGTAGNAISFTQAMTLDASGRLSVGTTTTYGGNLTLVPTNGNPTTASSTLNQLAIGEASANTAYKLLVGYLNFGGGYSGSIQAIAGGAGTDLLINADGGNVLVGTTSSSSISGSGIKLYPAVNGAGAPQLGIVTSASTNSTASLALYSTGAAAYRFYVADGGTIYATSTSISAISDATLKENVRDLETGLTEVLALRPRRFDWKNGDAQNVAGFVAQEVEQVLPELVTDYVYNKDDQGNDIIKKSLKMGDILPTMVKAIQEQQAIITALTARVAALESN